MKGITPIIAIILLLLITVSMAGFAFVFLQRTLEQTTESTETGLAGQLSQQGQTFKIDTIDDIDNIVYVRHTGYVNSNETFVSVYINDTIKECNWGARKDVWFPNSTARGCLITGGFSCPARIRITGPGNTDSASC